MSWLESRLKELERLEEYRKNLRKYLKMMKDIVSAEDPDARVFLFGSQVKGTSRVDSDIDVLIVTRLAGDAWERARLRAKINEALGEGNPFELHIATDEEFEGWYMKFLDAYEEV